MNFPPPRKSLGQHFLRDQAVVERIVKTAGVGTDDLVLEIGPGRGILTEKLLGAASGVVAVETDRTLAALLGGRHAVARLLVVEADVMKCDLAACLDEARRLWGLDSSPARVVANLPYNLSTPIITQLIENRAFFSDFTLMLQREVVERIASPPGNKTYGYFSVIVQAYCEVQALFDVPPHAFQPPPKVWSSVVKLTPRAEPLVSPADEACFPNVVGAAFGQRRKMIGNPLTGLCGGDRDRADAVLRVAGIDPKRRAETLSVADFVRLTTAFRSA